MRHLASVSRTVTLPVRPVVLILAVLVAGAAPAAQTSLGVGAGAIAGFGVQADLTLDDFTRDLPLSLRLGAGYSGRDAGMAWDARRVFINDSTNGTPDATANTWQVRLDLLLPVTELGRAPVRLGAGVRRAWFTGTYDFVGGNEMFDVTSSPWGVGVFADVGFAMSDRVDFALQAGLDSFFDARLEGHDTAYEPDGDDVNPRDGYTYDDADEAIGQPQLEWYGLVGLRIALGD
jgi:hypothetical protein